MSQVDTWGWRARGWGWKLEEYWGYKQNLKEMSAKYSLRWRTQWSMRTLKMSIPICIVFKNSLTLASKKVYCFGSRDFYLLLTWTTRRRLMISYSRKFTYWIQKYLVYISHWLYVLSSPLYQWACLQEAYSLVIPDLIVLFKLPGFCSRHFGCFYYLKNRGTPFGALWWGQIFKLHNIIFMRLDGFLMYLQILWQWGKFRVHGLILDKEPSLGLQPVESKEVRDYKQSQNQKWLY